LVANVDREQFLELWWREKNWPMLLAGFGLVMASVCLTFVRWYVLVRALGIPFGMTDAFRLGFLGYLMNFVVAGSVGGDLFKAFFIAHEQPRRRAEAVATVVTDRVVGLFALLLVTSSAILLSGISGAAPVVQAICNLTLVVTAVAAIFAVLLMVPPLSHGRLVGALIRVPTAGPVLQRLMLAVEAYRSNRRVLAVVTIASIGVHVLLPLALFLLAASLFDRPPSLAEHYIIVPLGMVAGALPFTPAGLGTFELAMERLYVLVPANANSEGIFVALAYRVTTILVAAIGVVYYWSIRREVTAVLEEAEHRNG
jgi:uncharacterized protein (TIRG00374 family)